MAAALMGIRVSLALGSAILASVAAHASAVFYLIVGALTGGWVQWALAHQGSNPFAALFVYCIAPLVGGVAIAHVLCPIPVLRGKNYGPNCMIILSLCVILGAAFWLVAGQTSARLNSLYVIPGAAIVIHLMLLSVFTHSRVRAQFK